MLGILQKSHWRHLIIGLLLYGVGVFFFAVTNPKDLPVPMLIIPFVYIFGCLYFTSFFIAKHISRLAAQASLLASVIAVPITLLLLLSSLHQLSARDIVLSVSIAVILIWYLYKLKN
jgi:hypothetical protein